MNKLIYSFCVVALFMMSVLPMQAGGVDATDIRKKAISLLDNGGAAGQEFCFTFPPCYEVPGANKIQLFIAAGSRGRVTVEVVGRGYRQDVITKPNDVVALDLAPGIAQAFTKPDNVAAPPEQIWSGAAIQIRSTVPIVVYGLTRFQFTTDSFLALPIEALGKEYISTAMADMTWMYPGFNLPSITCIAAPYDNTEVQITLGGDQTNITSGGKRGGRTWTVTMQRGDAYVISGNGPETDITGTVIRANKPVAVTSGNQCANVPTEKRWCDFNCEMEIPTDMWGRTYITPVWENRKFGFLMKMTAKEPNTQVFKNGQPWQVINTVGGSLGRGFIYERVSEDNRPAVFTSNKPINLSVFNPGQEDDNITTDPFQLVLYPVEQFQKEMLFCTPGIKGGQGYPINNISLIFKLNASGAIPDSLMYAQVQNGKFNFVKVKDRFGSTIKFIVNVNGQRYGVKECRLPGDGAFRLKHIEPFACYSYGGSDYDSYGHPTSAAFGIVSGDTVPPDPVYNVQCDGSVGVVDEAKVTDRPDDNLIRSNMASITLDPDNSYNYSLEIPTRIEAGTTVSTTWKLTVDNPDSAAQATVIFRDRARNQTVKVITYTPISVVINPKLVDYGLRRPGDIVTKDVWIVNKSVNRVENLTLRLKNGGVNAFRIIADPSPFALNAGDSIKVTVEYTAREEGEKLDSLGVGNDCVFRYRSLLRGRAGEPIITLDGQDQPNGSKAFVLDFGTRPINTILSQTFKVKSAGNVGLTVTKGTRSQPASPFAFDPAIALLSDASSLILSARGSGNDEKEYEVIFQPTTDGSFADTLVFSSDATRIDSVLIVKGIGVKPGITVTGIDFGRRRMALDGSKNYTTDKNGNVASVVISNPGTSNLIVRGATVKSLTPATAIFTGSLADFNGLQIPPGESRRVNIGFTPNDTANFTMVLSINNDVDSSAEATIIGTGIHPRVSITNIAFGVIPVSTPSTQKAILRNESYSFEDTLIVSDLIVLDAGNEIGSNNVAGTQGFSFDKASLAWLNQPIPPGSNTTTTGVNTEINATFVSANNGSFRGRVQTVSDARDLGEATSIWTAEVNNVPPQIRLASTPVAACVGSTVPVTVNVTNAGLIAINKLTISVVTPNAAFSAPVATTQIIPIGGSTTITSNFTPSAIGGQTMRIRVVPNDDDSRAQEVDLNGTGNNYPFEFQAVDVINVVGVQAGQYDAIKTVSIKMNKSDVNGALTTLDFVVTVDPTMLAPKVTNSQPDIRLMGPMSGWTVSNAITNVPGVLRFTASGATPLANVGANGQVIAEIDYNAGLPPAGRNSSVIGLRVNSQNQCAVITPRDGQYVAPVVCAWNLRRVDVATGGYQLQSIDPNPVTSAGTDIRFSVAYSAQTAIDIVDINGNIVASMVNEKLNAGDYTMRFVPTELSSGTYFVRMAAGPFNETRQIVITK